MADDLYTRQETLKLNTNLSIAIVGCGGVGYWAAKFFAMSGVPKLLLVDDDTLELHNLNRLDVPVAYIGRNKAAITKIMVLQLRPDCQVTSYPFKFRQDLVKSKIDFLIDCTDKIEVQRENEVIAKRLNAKYRKFGYDGTHITINNTVAQWGDGPDGYVITPSWVVPATVVAALGVASVMKYVGKEISCDIQTMYDK